uniref:Uncharacterized protein n=1 Tax=Anguilla anguilla TaxID=7936 RepID=A0A0E9U8P9_ANGAN
MKIASIICTSQLQNVAIFGDAGLLWFVLPRGHCSQCLLLLSLKCQTSNRPPT